MNGSIIKENSDGESKRGHLEVEDRIVNGK